MDYIHPSRTILLTLQDKEAKAMRAIIKKYEELGKMTVHEIQVKLKTLSKRMTQAFDTLGRDSVYHPDPPLVFQDTHLYPGLE